MPNLRRHFIFVIFGLLTLLIPSAALAQYSIDGVVTFWGDPGGGTQIEIGAHLNLFGPPEESVFLATPGGPFSIPIDDGTYYIVALMARDGIVGEPEDEDVLVWYDADGDGEPDQVTVSSGSVTGIDVDLGFVYVDIDATGANNGSSWADAFTNLQDGIDLAVSGVEVWAAEGTYVPGASRADSFLPKPGVRVCGGFTGVETIRQQRDWNAHETILSGDIGTIGTHTDNCFHVVRAEGSNPFALLDGVTIRWGYANVAANADDQGGGVRARGGGVTLANVTVIDNYASSSGGGVMVNTGGTVKAYNSSFINNQCVGGHGGGYYASAATAEPQTLVNCVFTGNYAWRGGGISLESAGTTPVLVNLSLSGNSAGGEGGGIFTYSTQSFLIHNSIFWGNTGTNPQISFWTTTPSVNYSIVQGGWATGSNILTGDPSFADAALRLNLDSPAIDAGDNTAVPFDTHDADGNHWTDGPVGRDRDFNWRVRNIPSVPDTGNGDSGDSIIDMGAYETIDPALIFWDHFEDGDLNEWSSVTGGP